MTSDDSIIRAEHAAADVLYMRRCLQLARLGEELVAPNPMVGAVIVHDGRIIGEGWHRRFGSWHAEPNAIRSVRDRSLLPSSTLYVSLEPCAHYGKTPPCAELIVREHIGRVVVGRLDPNPLVAGRGVELLRQAGTEVVTGVLEAECRALNKRFLMLHEHHRPYITLKWAQSADGLLDRCRTSAAEPVAVISNRVTKQLVHRLRAESMAILVGTQTALFDNPGLRTTRWSGRNPLRVLIDRSLRLPAGSQLHDEQAPTLVFSELSAYPFETHAEVVQIDFRTDIWPQVMQHLAKRQIHSLIVEGGARTLQSLLDAGLYDELHVEVGMSRLGEGVQAPKADLTGASMQIFDQHRLYTLIR